MPRLTLRTLLAYIDDTLEPDQARALGQKVADSEEAKALIERIKKVTRRRGLTSPGFEGDADDVADPNTVAAYLSDNLEGSHVRELEETCLKSDVHLAEVAACHQILTLVLTEPVRVPPSANQRMYHLVEAPASEPGRRPGKAIPVGGVAPRGGDQHDLDDPDAALLLGMRRYAASDSWAGRIGLVAAVGGVALFLALSVLMALPHEPSATSAGVSVASAPVPAPKTTPTPEPSTTTPAPPPKEVESPKKEPDIAKAPEPVEVKKEPDPKADPGPKLGDPVNVPRAGNDAIGTMATSNVIALTHPAEGGNWLRLEPGKPAVRASDVIMALPGFKADVKLDSGVVVHLWGNVPEQVSMKGGVMESRVRFHPPDAGIDADISLDAGRIYLTTGKPNGSKVRVRIGGDVTEVWDLVLPNNQADVMVQVNIAFVPGTPFARDGGNRPKLSARLVVLRGSIDFLAPRRDPSVVRLGVGDEAAWDNKVGTLTKGKPMQKEELFTDRVPLLEADYGKALQRVLSDAAANLSTPEGIRVLLKERLTVEPPLRLYTAKLTQAEVLSIIFPTKFAAYSQAAIADGASAGELLNELIDVLGDERRPYARQAAVIALSNWVAAAPGNTDLLVKGMIAKNWLEEDANLIAHLLRGYSSFAIGDPNKVDELVELLDHPQIAVREAALGNLLAFFDPDAAKMPELVTDVAYRREPGYDKFLKAWKARGEEIKAKMGMKK